MSIFADWHFCHEVRLSPQETSEYLHCLSLLRMPQKNWSSIQTSVAQLSDFDPLGRAYVLPALVDLIVSKIREPNREEVWEKSEPLIPNIVRLIRECIIYSNTLSACDSSLSDPILDLVEKLPRFELQEIIKTMDNLKLREPQEGNGRSYLEVDRFAYEIFVLSVIRVYIGMKGAWTGTEEQNRLIEHAKSGKIGLLPELLAVDILQSNGTGFDELLQEFPDDWLLYPEYMTIAIKTEIANREDDQTNIERLFDESVNFTWFQKNAIRLSGHDSGIWFLKSFRETGRNGNVPLTENTQLLAASLWQNMLWEYAAHLDRTSAAKRLECLWYLPENRNWNASAFLKNLYKNRNINWTTKALAQVYSNRIKEYKTKKGEIKNTIPSAISSPWLWYVPEKEDGDFHNYPELKKTFFAFRVFAAICILDCLYSWTNLPVSNVKNNLNLFRLFLNFGAALSLPDVQMEWDKHQGTYAWDYSLRGLGLYAFNELNKLATGLISPAVPNALWEQYVNIKKTKSNKGHSQLQILAKDEGMLICARWAYLSEMSFNRETFRSYIPKWKDFEWSLCEQLFPLNGCIPGSVQKNQYALWLLLHTGYWNRLKNKTEVVAGEDAEDKQITLFQVLTEDSPERCCKGRFFEQSLFTADAWQAALTIRILSKIPYGGIPEKEITTWRKSLQNDTKIPEKPMLLQLLLLILEQSPDLPDIDRTNYDIILNTIITVLDQAVNKNNSHFFYLLIEEIPDIGALFGTEILISACCLFFISLEKRAAFDPEWNALKYLMFQRILETSKNGTDLVERFHRKLCNFWNAECISGKQKRYTLKKVNSESWIPLTDHYIQSRGAELYIARKRQNIQRDGLLNHFLPVDINKSSYNQKLGIVCGIDRRRKDRTTVSLNFGQSMPEDKFFNRVDTPFKIGDLAVYNEAKQQILFPYMSTPDPDVTDIYHAEIKKISVKYGVELDKIPFIKRKPNSVHCENVLSIWAPNTLAFQHGEYPLNAENECYVSYDKETQSYLPIERDFFRLLLDSFCFGNQDSDVHLFFISCSNSGQNGGALFSLKPGLNYRLYSYDWMPESLDVLREEVFNVENALGIEVIVKKVFLDGIPRLSIVELIKENCRYAELFETGDIYIAKKTAESNGYSVTKTFRNKSLEIEADVKDGFFSDVGNVELTDGGWNLTHQRLGMAVFTTCKALFIRLSGNEEQQLHQIRQIIDMKVGDIFPLRSVSNGRAADGKGYILGRITDSGIRAYCSVQSLSFLSKVKNDDSKDRQQRMCIVENIHYLKKGNVVHTATPCELQNPPIETSVKGVVTEMVAQKGDRIENTLIKVACIDDGHVRTIHIPYSAFSSVPQISGDCIELKKENDGWIADTINRRIYVRALWKIELHSDGEMVGEYLGTAKLKQKQTNYHLTEDPVSPIIHLWSHKIKRNMEDLLCGIPLNYKEKDGSTPYVTEKDQLFTDWTVFPYAKWKNHVVLTAGNDQFWGEANKGDFAKRSRRWTVSAEIYHVRDDYYDLRRSFHPVQEQLAANKTDKQLIEKNLEWYKEWLSTGDFHLTGTIFKGRLHLDGHKLPKYIDGDVTQEWLTDIPFIQEEPLWYKKGRRLFEDNQRARVKMIPQGNQWFASCKQADPIPFDEKLLEILDVELNETVENRPMLFAGVDEMQRIRLEWGYGYTTVIPSDNVIDVDGKIIGPTLFFGDQINRFIILKDTTQKIYRLCAFVEHIQYSLEHKLWIDATENNIVQLLKVSVNVQEKTAIILQTSLSEDRIGTNNGSLLYGWDWKPSYNSKLDKESVELLLSENPESSEQHIFAMLSASEKRTKNQHQNLPLFSYISLRHSGALGALLQNKRVCLSAGTIETNYKQHSKRFLGNDYFLPFYLPNECSDENSKDRDQIKPSFVVNVMRRNFSVDESKMRVHYESDNKNAYLGYNMVVFLQEEKQNEEYHLWSGSVMNVPLRTEENLIRWVESQSSCLVSLGRGWGYETAQEDSCEDREISSGFIIAEVAPSILCKIPCEDIRGDYYAGTIARLSVETESILDNGIPQKKIIANVLMPSDKTYFIGKGRAVELLIMDDAAKNCNPLLKEREAKQAKYGFTVSSFPQIRIRYSELVEKMIRIGWPRIGYVKWGADGLTAYEPDEINKVRAAMIRIDTTADLPSLSYIEGKEEPSSWSKLTFMDQSSGVIARTVSRCAWHYHDKCYAQLTEDDWSVYPLPDGRNFEDVVVFPNENGRLRVSADEFRRYGYSSREILEYGLPKGRETYPVAGVEKDSIWIELLPGRLVELPKTLLFIGKQRRDLANFDTSFLSAGDELKISSNTFSFKGGQRELVLQRINFGIRSYQHPEGKLFLPVKEHILGGVVLGAGQWQLIYPCETPERYAVGSTVKLNNSNEIATVEGDPTGIIKFKWKKDTVIVQHKNDQLVVTDLNLRVRIQREKQNWNGAEWLYDVLNDTKLRKRLFTALGGYLPMTVDFVSDVGNGFVVVSYSQEQDTSFAIGTVLCCIALGTIEDNNFLYVLLRSGKQLIRVLFNRLLPGFPIKEGPEIIDYLCKHKENIWITKTESGWVNGVHPKDRTGKTEIYLQDLVVEANGIVCKNQDSAFLVWLPIDQASFVSVKVNGSYNEERIRKTWAAMEKELKNSALDAIFMENGAVSLIETDPTLKTLSVNAKCRAIPISQMKTEAMYSCIAKFYPKGNLFELFSEEDNFDYNSADSRPLHVTVTDKVGSVIKAVVNESLHRRIKMLPAVCGGFSKTVDGLFSEKKRYFDIMSDASSDSANGKFNPLLGENITNEERMVYLYSWLLNKKFVFDRMVFCHICKQLAQWLKLDSTNILLGTLPVSLQNIKAQRKPDKLTEICGVLSGGLLLNFIGRTAQNNELKSNASKLSVHTLRVLGIACEAAVQQEIILKFLRSEKEGIYWDKLKVLSLGGEQSNGNTAEIYNGTFNQLQYERAAFVCDYILRQGVLQTDGELKLTAMSLAHCMELPVDYDDFERLMDKMTSKPYCWSLIRLSRALTPSYGTVIAFNELPPQIYNQALKIWESMLTQSDDIPYLYLESGIRSLMNKTDCGRIEQLVKRCIAQLDDVIKI